MAYTITPVIDDTSTALATSTLDPTRTQDPPSTHPFTATFTPTQVDTVEPEKALETIQPLLEDPMNCNVPCFWGILPGRTFIDTARIFFGTLGFKPFEGVDEKTGKYFYSIGYESGIGRDSSVTLYYNRYGLVENIKVRPEIIKQEEGSVREWIAFSPETLIKQYGKPSEVKFTLHWGPNKSTETTMTMYFNNYDLVVFYLGNNLFPSENHSPLFCPLTDPLEHIDLWIGPDPPNLPAFDTAVSLEWTTSLTMDQFNQLMLGDPQKACFIIDDYWFYP